MINFEIGQKLREGLYTYIGKDPTIEAGFDFKNREGYKLKFVVTSISQNKFLCFKFNGLNQIIALNKEDIELFSYLISICEQFQLEKNKNQQIICSSCGWLIPIKDFVVFEGREMCIGCQREELEFEKEMKRRK